MRRRLTVEEMAAQLELFPGPEVSCTPEPRPASAALLVAEPLARMTLEVRPLPSWVDPDDIPEEGDYPTQTIAQAADCSPIKTRAACSIFALGSEAAAKQVISEFMLVQAGAEPEFSPPQDIHHRRIIREAGITRHISMRYQETEEWAEKERIRRAKQKLPKPPKQTFRLRSKAAA